jgi:hypothetical protein
MPPDITTMLLDLVKEIKVDITDIKEKQATAAVSIGIIETMQKAIENLKIDERLRQVERAQSSSKGGLSTFIWLIPTILSIIGVGTAIYALVKN